MSDDQPYSFIDPNEPNRRRAEKRMEEAAEEGNLFGDSKKAEDIPTRSRKGSKFSRKELNPEDWPETRNRVFHYDEEDPEEETNLFKRLRDGLKQIFW